MPELEIHHEVAHHDPAGQKIGVMAGVLAVALAIVTIASHRTHTAAVIHKSSANDAWSHYQSTRIKLHNVELGANLITAVGVKSEAAEKLRADYESQRHKYEEQSQKIQEEAEQADHAAEADERRGLRFDLGEGLLEIGLVLTSLYFLSHKNMFPVMGIIAGVAGTAVAITGLFV